MLNLNDINRKVLLTTFPYNHNIFLSNYQKPRILQITFKTCNSLELHTRPSNYQKETCYLGEKKIYVKKKITIEKEEEEKLDKTSQMQMKEK